MRKLRSNEKSHRKVFSNQTKSTVHDSQPGIDKLCYAIYKSSCQAKNAYAFFHFHKKRPVSPRHLRWMRQLNQTMAAAGSESHISFQMAYARSTQQRKNSSPMTKPAQYQNVRDGLPQRLLKMSITSSDTGHAATKIAERSTRQNQPIRYASAPASQMPTNVTASIAQ